MARKVMGLVKPVNTRQRNVNTQFESHPVFASFMTARACLLQGLVVLFMTATAFSLYDSDNLAPLAPFGAGGVLKGAVAAFFGFLGFDEVN